MIHGTYYTNKIEGSPLSRGDTERIIQAMSGSEEVEISCKLTY